MMRGLWEVVPILSYFPFSLNRNKDKKCPVTRHVIVFIIFWKLEECFNHNPKS